MNNSFFLQQIQKTSNLDANLISRQYKLNLIAYYRRVKFKKLKMKQSQSATLMGLSSRNLQRYRNDINMLSLYKINPDITIKRTKKTLNTKFDNTSHRDLDLKRPQMISNDFKTSSSGTVENEKHKFQGGSNIQIIEHYLDEIFHYNNP